MIKSLSFEEAEKVYEQKYSNGKRSKSISICKKLHEDYKDFCYIDMKRQDMSYRLRILMVRDMLENIKKEL